MACKKKDSGHEPWEIGAYYTNPSETFISEAWGQKLPRKLKIRPGAIWRCDSVLKKKGKLYPWESEEEERTYIRFVTKDPRYRRELSRYVHYDLVYDTGVWGWLMPARFIAVGPLVALATAEDPFGP